MVSVGVHVAHFFGGALIANSVPHITTGLEGRPFQTPFASPPGKGESSPIINVLWGGFNLAAGVLLLKANPVEMGLNTDFLTCVAGGLGISLFMAHNFAKVHEERQRKQRS